LTITLSVNDMATLSTPSDPGSPDPHDPKDAALLQKMGNDPEVRAAWKRAFDLIAPYRYAYNWSWMGRPAIQFPQDLVALQEIIWRTRPEVVVETGIAHGGSLVFSASILALLGGEREAIGIDIDVRAHNRAAIEAHPMASRIVMFEGSSVDEALAARVRERVAGRSAMVILDSNHTADHVARELALYAPLVRAGCFLVVMDTAVEYADPASIVDRPWGPGNSPMTAVDAFLAREPRFVVDAEYDAKLLFTVAPRGYLRAVSDPAPA
jgi:cephalosporin hydroxylase